jgi:hypothetical protein
MKPGNSVEEKTLTTGTRREGRALWQQGVQDQLWKTRTAGSRQPAVGSHGREARVTPTGSRLSEWTQGPAIKRGQRARAPKRRAAAVISCPAPADEPTIPGHLWRQEVTEEAKCKLKE